MPKKLQRDAVRSVEDVADALAEARRVFRDAERSLRRAARNFEKSDDGDISSALGVNPPAAFREEVNAALQKLERRRHEMRLKIFALGLAQGHSIGEMGKLWGFSRQLASRYAHELNAARSGPSRRRKAS